MIKVEYKKEGIRVEVGKISKYNPNVPFKMNIIKNVNLVIKDVNHNVLKDIIILALTVKRIFIFIIVNFKHLIYFKFFYINFLIINI